jgi:hypothetical protein
LTFLLAFTVVVSVVAAPVAATGHDPTHVGDGDPIEVNGDDGSVSVDTGDGGVTVGTDGVETDTDDATDGLESGSTDDATDGVATTQDEDDEELPFNYSTVNSTLSLVPVDLCQSEPPAEPPEPPAEPPVENPAPVDPTNPPSAPLTQCDVFDPYDPPFDPTDVPDDPEADYHIYQREVGPDGVDVFVIVSGSPDSDYPFGRTIVDAEASPEGVDVYQYSRNNDGSRNHIASSDVEHETGTRTGSVTSDARVIGKRLGANVVCDGAACTIDQGVAPVGEQEIPTGGSGGDDGGSDDGGSGAPEPPAEVPCEPPVGPGDVPEPPVDPTNPPEPLPPVENPLPVNPTNPPNPPVGPCDAYDPNDPPNPQPDPDAGYTVYQVSQDGVVVGGNGAYNDEVAGFTLLMITQDEDGELQVWQYGQYNDGQKRGTLFSDVRYTPGTKQGQADVDSRIIGKRLGANVVCDGSACTIDQGAAPVGKQEIPTGSSGSGDDSGGSDGDDGGSGAPEPPAEVPCEPPVGPGDVPEPPVDPTNPPEPLPPVENPLPVNPTNPPNPPVGPCDAYDPNDPPNPQPNPDAGYTVYQVSQDGVVVGGNGAYNDEVAGFTLLSVGQDGEELQVWQYGQFNDGQKPGYVISDVRYTPGTKQGQADVDSWLGGKRAGVTVVCDGSACTVAQSVAPVGEQEIPTGGESSDSSAPTLDTSTDSQQSNSEGTSGGSASTGSSELAGPSSSDAVAVGDTTVSATAVRDLPPTLPSAFENGIPDAASAAEALMDMV